MINTIGYVSAIFAIVGAGMVTSTKRKIRAVAFSLWIFTNAFECLYLGWYLGNTWAFIQFFVFWVLAVIGLINNLRKNNENI